MSTCTYDTRGKHLVVKDRCSHTAATLTAAAWAACVASPAAAAAAAWLAAMLAVLALAAVVGPAAEATSAAAKASTLDSASVTAVDAHTAAVSFHANAQQTCSQLSEQLSDQLGSGACQQQVVRCRQMPQQAVWSLLMYEVRGVSIQAVDHRATCIGSCTQRCSDGGDAGSCRRAAGSLGNRRGMRCLGSCGK